VPTARQNNTTPEILPSDRENMSISFSSLRLIGGQRILLLGSRSIAIVLGGKLQVVAVKQTTCQFEATKLSRCAGEGQESRVITLQRNKSKADCLGGFQQRLWRTRESN
jgi:hypothetical protein